MEPSTQATKEAASTEVLSTFDQHPKPSAKYPSTPCPGYPFYTVRDVATEEGVDYVRLKLHEGSEEARVFASLIEKGTSDEAAVERLAYMRQHAHDIAGYVSPGSSFIEAGGKRYVIKIQPPEGQKLQELLQPATGPGNRKHWHQGHGEKYDTMAAYYKEHAHSIEDLRKS
ncbi:hypothetical protein RB595_001209 [Gaeumannomyces hyphopodioides]